MKHARVAPAGPCTGSLLGSYRPPGGTYDEMFALDGTLREGLTHFVELLDALGPQELNRRWEQARRIIREDGVTYNVHGDPQGRDRRWELDALPLVLGARQWAQLAAGLTQRARLLNALLVDVYGPGRMVREGVLPAELVAGHPGFLRPCHGWTVPKGCYLHLYSAHLARSPDGKWWVVADRTQVPSGAGYAVENRIVISRMLPHVFHHCRIQRLAGFFITLRETLGELAQRHHDHAQTVLLSPGPASPTYFEDSYLSRYLGYTLVEGEDLTVRDSRVFLKTLGGLISVDTILRRVRDEHCDPLELDGHSHARLGASGLVLAARRGNVAVANALGSGLLEAPALLAYLPALCRRLLGEELALDSVRTWWCGDGKSLSHVLENLDRLLLRTANPDPKSKPIDGASLSKPQRAELAARIKAAPGRFVAQEMIVRSTAPVWSDGAVRPGHVALRTFLVASGGSYQVMPGALAHVGDSTQAPRESMFLGHGTKDVWVVADGPVAAVTLLPPGSSVSPRRSGNDLPSRVADNLFWLGRDVERAENLARLLRGLFSRLISESSADAASELGALFAALVAGSPARIDAGRDPGAIERQSLAYLYDAEQTGSLRNLLAEVARVATAVRDRLSLDTWRILQRIEDDFQTVYPLGVVSVADVLAMLNQLIVDFSAFSGGVMENMTRGPGWQFLDLGRRIERALATVRLLRTCLWAPSLNGHAVHEALLEIADSSMTYRNRYATNLQLGPLLDLLVTDETNPRSIAYQLAALSRHVDRLPRKTPEGLLSDEQRTVLELLSTIRLADVAVLDELNERGVRQRLDDFLMRIAGQLAGVADAISHKYLVHAGPAHQMADIYRTPQPPTPLGQSK